MRTARLRTRSLLTPALAASVLAIVIAPATSMASTSGAGLDSAVRPVAHQGGSDGCAAASALPDQASRQALVRATLCRLNIERSKRGIRSLRISHRLSKAARRHANDMVRRNYFSHDSLGGGDFVRRIRRTGYLRSAGSWFVGENLAWGSGSLSTPGATVDAWMKSPLHRANILTRRFREIGIGVVSGAPVHGQSDAATYATDFGRRD